MIQTIYTKAFNVILKKPFRLLGLIWLANFLMGAFSALFGVIPGFALAFNLAISVALSLIFLQSYRGKDIHAIDLFVCLKDWQTAKRIIFGMSWMCLWICLWALIPIVGWVIAIIKIYTWRLTPYILAFEPEVPITEALKVSEERTKGYRLSMFGADFIVYGVIFVINFFFSLLMLIPVPIIQVFLLFILSVINLVIQILVPLFLGLVQSAFYEEIMSKKNPSPVYDEN